MSTLPDRTPSKQGFLLLDETFSAGRLEPTRVVVEGDVRSADVQAALARLEERLESDPRFSDARTELAPDGRLAVLSVALRGDPTASTATGAVRDLRRDLVPEAFGGTGARTLVGGLTPANVDYVEVNNAARLPVFAFVLGLSFVLLLVAFRSVIVPVKAILLNLLSVGAAYGLLVLVFQHGVGNEALRLQRSETIEVWVPLLLFSLLFGLSMDYHVFLLSRIRERYLTTGDSTGSVAFGIGSTGRIITGAALIIIVVFTGFTLGELVMFQQMGFGIAVALLLDATLVRSVLVPASMRLLGEWNWYLPRWLSWLPHFEVEASGLTAASARRTLT